MYHYIKGADNQTPQWKKENMFIQMLKVFLLVNGKWLSCERQEMHQVYKGLSVVKEWFGWNDEFVRP